MNAQKKKIISNLIADYHLLAFDELDSTNEEAKRLAKAGGSHGAVVWAKKQTGGKGRMGRAWVSDDGNLFVSLLLQPEKPFEELAQLSFVAALSALEAIAPMLPEPADLQTKWPNDILLADKKLGGILLESFRTDGSEKAWVVVGVGINVDSHPTKTDFPATCLKEAGVELVSAKIILSRFIHHFIERYDEWSSKGFAPIRKNWLVHAWHLKERLVARLPDGGMDMKTEGIFDGIDADGSLVLIVENEKGVGKKHIISAADVYA